MRKKVIKVALLICLISMMLEITGHAAEDTVTSIKTDTSYSEIIDSKTDKDWFKIKNKKDYFKVNLKIADTTKSGDGLKLVIYAEDGETVIKSYKGITDKFVSAELPYTGDFYIKVYAGKKINCPYELEVNTYTDSKWENESNNLSEEATDIDTGKTYKGALNKSTDIDWYEVKTKKDAFKITLSTKADEEAVKNGWNLYIYPADSSTALVSYKGITSKQTTFDIPFKGKYLIKVTYNNKSNSPIDCVYNLQVTEKTGYWETEKNNTKSNANSIEVGKYMNGNLYSSTDTDYIKYKAPCYGILKIHFATSETNTKAGWKINVISASGTTVLNRTFKVTDSEGNIEVEKGKTYYIKVTAAKTSNAPIHSNYKIKVTFKPKTSNVTNVKATETQKSIKLTWDRVEGANGYKIYTYDSEQDEYVLFKTTASANCTISGLSPASKCTYYVKAYQTYNEAQYDSSKYVKITTATKPKVVTKLKITDRNTESIGLSWNQVAGADGYGIYKYNESEKEWKCVKKTADTNYTLSNLSAGTTYRIKVRAYITAGSKKVWGEYSDTLTAITNPAKVTNVKTDFRTTNSIKLTWKQVKGATGYKIYRYNNSSQKWVTVDTTTFVGYNVKNLNDGTFYKFKVVAYKSIDSGKLWGEESEVLETLTRPAETSIKSILTTNSSLTVKWYSVTGAEGYAVEYSRNRDFSSKKTVYVTDTKLTLDNLKEQETYYVRVRAYITYNDTKIFSGYSDCTWASIVDQDIKS